MTGSISSLVSLAPQVPFYVATAAQNFLFEREKEKKKVT